MSIPPAKKNAPRLPKESGAAVDPKCSVPFAQTSLASVAKGTHARRTHRPAFRGVIVLDLRQQACVLCLAKNAPERPAGLRVFPEHGRQMARQTRQMGCRPSTRITQPAALQARENHVCPCQLTLAKAHAFAPAKTVGRARASVFFRDPRFPLPAPPAGRLYFAEKLWYPESTAPAHPPEAPKNSHAGGIS